MRVRPLLSTLLFLGGGLTSSAAAVPLGSAFTYQGHLLQNGVPADGTVHLRFSLWDALGAGSPPVGGNPIGASQLVAHVPVADGVFTVTLNAAGQFGATPFNGDARWIQIEVCTDPGCATSTTLSPRQPILAAPYASTSTSKPWTISGSNVSFTGGNVGIGTTAPEGPLDVYSGNSSFVRVSSTHGDLHFNGGVDGVFGLVNLNPSAAGRTEIIGGGASRVAVLNTGQVGIGTTAPVSGLDVAGFQDGLRVTGFQPFMTLRDQSSGNARSILQSVGGALNVFTEAYASGGNPSALLHFSNTGQLGVGTSSPTAKLDVRGDIRLGASGQHYAAGSEENLRILRGKVAETGGAPLGCCFSASRLATGWYSVNFSTPFSGPPSVTVTPEATPTGNAQSARLQAVSASGFTVILFDDVTHEDSNFYFIAVGPR